VRRIDVAALAPGLGQHVLLVQLQHREFSDVLEIAVEIALRNKNGNFNGCHRLFPRRLALLNCLNLYTCPALDTFPPHVI
jgi:hypothetical protein